MVRWGTYADCWEHEVNKDKRPKNWKKKEDMEVGVSNIKVLLRCTKTSAIKYETDKVLFEIDMCNPALKKLDEISVPSNSHNESKSNMGNTNMEGIKKDGLAGKKVQVGWNVV